MFRSAIERLNDRRDAVGDAGEDAGFTLIELMVVLLILAILLAIAIPTFLGVTKSANDRAAQSNLNTALVNAKSIFQQQGQTYALSGMGQRGLRHHQRCIAGFVAVHRRAQPQLRHRSRHHSHRPGRCQRAGVRRRDQPRPGRAGQGYWHLLVRHRQHHLTGYGLDHDGTCRCWNLVRQGAFVGLRGYLQCFGHSLHPDRCGVAAKLLPQLT